MLFIYFYLVPVVFYGTGSYGLYRFINIARKWPTLMLHWESVESELPKWRNQYEKRQLAQKVKMVSIAILLCSLGRYIFYLDIFLNFNIFGAQM